MLIVRNTQKMTELHIFGILEVCIHHQSAHGSSYPDMPLIITCYKTGLVTIINRISFQVITMVHKNLFTTLTVRHIVDAACKCSNPDASMLIFVYTINIVVTQTINITFLMLITGQLIVIAISLFFSFHQAIPFGCNPEILFTVLQDEINITTQRSAAVRHSTVFGQIALIYTVLIIYP